MLDNLFLNVSSNVTIIDILVCSFVALILGIIIALTYKYTSRYNKNYLITITSLPFLVMMVILMVNGNLGTSIAILGAFSLVRFRSLPGMSKEILYGDDCWVSLRNGINHFSIYNYYN